MCRWRAARPVHAVLLGDGSKTRWASFRTISNGHWHSGNVVLAGDSAHTANFTIGMGTTLAIGDAIALAESRNLQPAARQDLAAVVAGPREDRVGHLAGHPAGERVLLARVVAADKQHGCPAGTG
jgi:2-polyprenyl-6-methoxyphenol hydroxylase-like FAD-dependent oxidoreductase